MSISVCVCPERNPRAAAIVAGLLEQDRALEVTRCASGAEGSAQGSAAAEGGTDVVVIPVGLPDMRDLTHVRGALRHHPAAAIIVLSLYQDSSFMQLLREAGASGFLALDEVVYELPRMIRRLVAARTALPQAI